MPPTGTCTRVPSDTMSPRPSGRPRGPVWNYFRKVSGPPYSTGVPYAACLRCNPAGPTPAAMAAISDAADRRIRTAAALAAGVLPGKPDVLGKHLRDECHCAPNDARELGRRVVAEHSAKRARMRSTTTPSGTDIASSSTPVPSSPQVSLPFASVPIRIAPAQTSTTNPSQLRVFPATDIPPIQLISTQPATPTSSSSIVTNGAAIAGPYSTALVPQPKDAIRHHISLSTALSPPVAATVLPKVDDEHCCLLVQLCAVQRLPLRTLFSPEFHQLRSFYNRKTAIDTMPTLGSFRTDILPRQAAASLELLRTALHDGPLLSRGYTLTLARCGSLFAERPDATPVLLQPPHFSLTYGARKIAHYLLHGITQPTTPICTAMTSVPAGNCACSPVWQLTPSRIPSAIVAAPVAQIGQALRIVAHARPTCIVLQCMAHFVASLCSDVWISVPSCTVLPDILHICYLSRSPIRPPGLPNITRWIPLWCYVAKMYATLRSICTPAKSASGDLAGRSSRMQSSPDAWKSIMHAASAAVPLGELCAALSSTHTTLADVFYGLGVYVQCLKNIDEPRALSRLEARFSMLELPLFFLSLILHPRYMRVARAVVDAHIIPVATVAEWIQAYAHRWQCAARDVDPTTAVLDWLSGRESGRAWCRVADACTRSPGAFWWDVGGRSRAETGAVQCVAEVAIRIFAVRAAASDVDDVFRDLVARKMGGEDKSRCEWHEVGDAHTIRCLSVVAAEVTLTREVANNFERRRLMERERWAAVEYVRTFSSGVDSNVQVGRAHLQSGTPLGEDDVSGEGHCDTDEEGLTQMAMNDFPSFVETFERAFPIINYSSAGDRNVREVDGAETDARLAEDEMTGFRGFKLPLLMLLGRDVVGQLAPLSKLDLH